MFYSITRERWRFEVWFIGEIVSGARDTLYAKEELDLLSVPQIQQPFLGECCECVCLVNIEKREDRAPRTSCLNVEEFKKKNTLQNCSWSSARSMVSSSERVARKI